MGRRPYGLDAAALVYRDIHDNRALFHEPEHLFSNELGRPQAGYMDRADEKVAFCKTFFDIMRIGVEGLHPSPPSSKDVVDIPHPAGIRIQYGDAGAKSSGYFCRVHAHNAAAQDDHAPGFNARDAAQEHAPAAVGFQEVIGPSLNREAARHLAHWREYGQAPVVQLEGLVGYGRDILVYKLVREPYVSGEVEEGKDR